MAVYEIVIHVEQHSHYEESFLFFNRSDLKNLFFHFSSGLCVIQEAQRRIFM